MGRGGLVAAGAVLALALWPAAATSSVHDVDITDTGFSPRTVYVLAGDTVRWTNRGSGPHSSTSDSGVWDSGTLLPGQSFSYTFSGQAQLYRYHDTWNPSASGEVFVVAATPTPSPSPTPLPSQSPTPTPTPGCQPPRTPALQVAELYVVVASPPQLWQEANGWEGLQRTEWRCPDGRVIPPDSRVL